MNKMPLIFALFCLIFVFSLTTLSAEGIMEMFAPPEEPEEVPTLQELFEGMAEDIPPVAILKPEIGEGVDPELAKEVLDNLISIFIKQNIYRPYSITKWLEESYLKNGQNVADIVKTAAIEKFAVNTLITSSFRLINGKILLRLGFYHLADPLNPVYFLRYFDTLESWYLQIPELLQEIKLRENKAIHPFKTSSIYVKNFPSSLYLYSELNTGEFEFTNISILKIGPQDFRKNQDLIRDLLTYELHSSQIVSVISDDLQFYHKPNGKSPCEYTIDGELRISSKMQLILFTIYKNAANGNVTKMFDYQVPVNGIDISTLHESLRYITKIIYDQILLDSDLENVSYNNFNFSSYGDRLYFNNFFIGNPVQNNFCLPVGCHWFSLLKVDDNGKVLSGKIDESTVAVFVSPMDLDGQIFDRTTARYIQQLLTTAKEN
ncbi:MAG: hypothetical protein JXR70_00210 [Spirochaetales bacterium]|nr:hypothetical protein [Spirochaetales bacterium]